MEARPAPPPPARPARPVVGGSTEHAHGITRHEVQVKSPLVVGCVTAPTLPPRPRVAATSGPANTADIARLLARKPPPIPSSTPSARFPLTRAPVPTSSNGPIPIGLPSAKAGDGPVSLAGKQAGAPLQRSERGFTDSAAELPDRQRRLPPPPMGNARPILPPPINLATKPVIEHPKPSDSAGCLKCHDFTSVDEHASRFPRSTVSSLLDLARSLTSPFDTETEKARAIFVWLSLNIIYDVQAFMSGNIQHATPESTLRSGLAVCDGYAGLFMHLAQLAGIKQVSKVTGHAKGYGYIPVSPDAQPPVPESNHAWNRIFLDGQWRLIDPCWGSGALVGRAWDQHLNSYWFTADPEEFGAQHFAMNDPNFDQCFPGKSITWEQYIMEPERPQTYGDFQRLGFSVSGIEPERNTIRTGQRILFRVAKRCVHSSTRAEDNYVLLLTTSDNKRTPMILDGSGGWSATIFVPQGSAVTLSYVSEIGGQDARGVTVQEYERMCGRKGMNTRGLVKWTPG